MSGQVLRWGLPVVLAASICHGSALGQAPTVNNEVPKLPGAGASPLGAAPGANTATLDNSPGAATGMLGGRAGTSVPRVYGTTPSGVGPTDLQTGITAPKPVRIPPSPVYGTFALPTDGDEKNEGPDAGLTLDQAIDFAIKNNLSLRSKYYEIPLTVTDFGGMNVCTHRVTRRSAGFAANTHGSGAGLASRRDISTLDSFGPSPDARARSSTTTPMP